MSLIAKEKGSSKLPPMPEGSYTAVCYGVIDLGVQTVKFENSEKEQDQVLILWAFPGETVEIDGEEKPRTISKTYTKSLHERSGLRKDLKSWRGREFTEEELKGFSLTKILGAACMLQIIHKETKAGTFANIASIMSLPKGMPAPACDMPPVVFDADESSEAELAALPEWIQNKITESRTWKERFAPKPTSGASGFVDAEDDGELPWN